MDEVKWFWPIFSLGIHWCCPLDASLGETQDHSGPCGKKEIFNTPGVECRVPNNSDLFCHHTNSASIVHDILITVKNYFSLFSVFNLRWSKVTFGVSVSSFFSSKVCIVISMFHRAFFNSIIDKHQHIHFFTFKTVLV